MIIITIIIIIITIVIITIIIIIIIIMIIIIIIVVIILNISSIITIILIIFCFTISFSIPYAFCHFFSSWLSFPSYLNPHFVSISLLGCLSLPTYISADHTSESSIVFRRVGRSLLLKSAIGGNYLYASPEVKCPTEISTVILYFFCCSHVNC